jgi:glucose/arabinose dehydrogenase
MIRPASVLAAIISAMNLRAAASCSIVCVGLLMLLTSCGSDKKNPFSVKSEVVTSADRPITMAFAPDGRLFYGEHQTGNIRIVTADGKLLPEPFAHVDTQIGLEWGLTGLAFDPTFDQNHYIYVYYTQVATPGPPSSVTARPVLTRFTERDNKGVDPTVIIGDLPETDPKHPGYNANGRVNFGPDGNLYLTVGDYDVGSSRDVTKAPGKLLRVSKLDGSALSANPFVSQTDVDPRIYAYGFREPFDFVFHPKTGKIYGTDNTPVSCEELNVIEPGGDYGFPDIGQFPYSDCQFGNHIHGFHFFAKKGMRPEDFLSNTYVSGIAFVDGAKYPTLGSGLLVCESEMDTHDLRRLSLSDTGSQIVADDVVIDDCNMDVKVSPDGTIYYSNEKEIRRLVFEPTPKD